MINIVRLVNLGEHVISPKFFILVKLLFLGDQGVGTIIIEDFYLDRLDDSDYPNIFAKPKYKLQQML